MVASEVLGGRVIWHAETDPDASYVLKAHHPDVPNHGDITAADWHGVERPDIVTMGVPCQAVSAAGRQLVEDDPRWLWPAAHRYLTVHEPWVVMFENVRNLISIRQGAVWRYILEDLRSLGYAVRWLTIGACAVGAPHHRHRVFLLAARRPDPAEAVRVEVDECDGRTDLLPTPVVRDSGTRGEGDADYWQRRREVKGRTAGMPLGAAVRLLHDAGTGWAEYAPAVELWAEILGRPAPNPVEPRIKGDGVRLAAALPEWMMGLPAGHLVGQVGRGPALRLAGNGVCPQQGIAAFRHLFRMA